MGLHKFLTRAFFLLALAANMLGTSRFPIGCMKRQHAVVFESSCERNSIKNFLPAEPTGHLIPLLTCSSRLLFFFLLFEQIISKSNFPFSRVLYLSPLLPLESKQCPLTLAWVLACADPAEELWFWSKNEA